MSQQYHFQSAHLIGGTVSQHDQMVESPGGSLYRPSPEARPGLMQYLLYPTSPRFGSDTSTRLCSDQTLLSGSRTTRIGGSNESVVDLRAPDRALCNRHRYRQAILIGPQHPPL